MFEGSNEGNGEENRVNDVAMLLADYKGRLCSVSLIRLYQHIRYQVVALPRTHHPMALLVDVGARL